MAKRIEDYKQYEPKNKFLINLAQKQFGTKKKYQYESRAYFNKKMEEV